MQQDTPQDLAKAYMDMWQQQWSQMGNDPQWQQMAQQQWQQFAAGMMANGMPGAKMASDDPARPQTHAPAPELGAQLLAECFTRMARLEARVADLESKLRG